MVGKVLRLGLLGVLVYSLLASLVSEWSRSPFGALWAAVVYGLLGYLIWRAWGAVRGDVSRVRSGLGPRLLRRRGGPTGGGF